MVLPEPGFTPEGHTGRPLFPEALHFSMTQGVDVEMVGNGLIAFIGKPCKRDMRAVASSRAFKPGDFEALMRSFETGSVSSPDGNLRIDEFAEDGDGNAYVVLHTKFLYEGLLCASEGLLDHLLSALTLLMTSKPEEAYTTAGAITWVANAMGDCAALHGAHLLAAEAIVCSPSRSGRRGQIEAIEHAVSGNKMLLTDYGLSVLETTLRRYRCSNSLSDEVEQYLEEIAKPIDLGDELVLPGNIEAVLALARSKGMKSLTQASPWILEAASRGYVEECASVIEDAFERSSCSANKAAALLREVTAYAEDLEGLKSRHEKLFSELGVMS